MSDNLERRVWLAGEEAAWLADKIVAYDDYCKDAARFLLMLSEVQQQLAAITAERDALKARIEEAEKQQVGWIAVIPDSMPGTWRYKFHDTEPFILGMMRKFKVYASPIPSPDTSELLRKAREEELAQEPVAWKHVTSGGYDGPYMREQILQFNPEELQKFAKDLDLKDFVIHSSTPLYEKA